jgi:hypothetical protein
VDASDRAHPHEISAFVLPGRAAALGVAVLGEIAFLGTSFGGDLRVLDTSALRPPALVATVGSPSLLSGMARLGDALLVGGEAQRMWVFDASGRRDPRPSGAITAGDTVFGLATEGTTAYLAAGEAGLVAADLSDPARPRVLSRQDVDGGAWDVAVRGGFAYVARGWRGLQVMDAREAQGPRVVSELEWQSAFASAVVPVGDLAYVVERLSQLLIVDVSDPGAPHRVGSFEPSAPLSPVIDVVASAGHLYLVAWQQGISIVDVTDPERPAEVAMIDIPGTETAYVSGGVLYVAAGTNGLAAFDVTDPSRPARVATHDTPGHAWSVSSDEDTVWVSDGPGGLHALAFMPFELFLPVVP